MTVVWLIGRFDIAEAATIAVELPALLAGAEVCRFDSPSDALRYATRTPADIVLVVQHRPAEFSRRDAEALVGTLQLARFVVGLGPWCASHGRSERLWPEAVAVPLAEVTSRLRREAAGHAAGEPPLPLTAGREELLLAGLFGAA